MALKLIATYSKRLGLPGYSSHQFSVCVETEISNTDDIAGESSRLYRTLQESVDEEIQRTGFVPGEGYGNSQPSTNGNGHGQNGTWQCSDKQRDLILKLIEDHNLDKADVESLARERFGGQGVKQLNRLQASGLIDELLERTGGKKQDRHSRNGRPRSFAGGGSR